MKQHLPVLVLSAAMMCDLARHAGRERVAHHSTSRPSLAMGENGPDAVFRPVVGKLMRYTVHTGDTLLKVARHTNSDSETLERLNGLTGERLTPGQTLLLPTVHILPSVRRNAVVLNIPERGVYVFRQGRLVGRFPVAIGMRTWETPVGRFKVVRKVKNPAWIPPKVMVKREHIPESLVKPGATNPLGDRWIGWSAPEVGFHSTSLVQTIGHLASHACVRMYPESAHKLFDNVRIGTPIFAEYEPVKLGKRDGVVYLSVSPDVYRSGKMSLEVVQERLEDAGITAGVDEAKVKRIVARQDGFPWPIARDPDATPPANPIRTTMATPPGSAPKQSGH